MSISKQIEAVLVELRERLDEVSSPWMVTGSTAAALHGVPLEPLDVDVETDERGAYGIERRLGGNIVEGVQRRADEDGTSSCFGRFLVEGVSVEVMGGMRIKEPGGEWRGPHDVAARTVQVEVAGAPLPIASLDALEQLYDELGRTERADVIRAYRSAPKRAG